MKIFMNNTFEILGEMNNCCPTACDCYITGNVDEMKLHWSWSIGNKRICYGISVTAIELSQCSFDLLGEKLLDAEQVMHKMSGEVSK